MTVSKMMEKIWKSKSASTAQTQKELLRNQAVMPTDSGYLSGSASEIAPLDSKPTQEEKEETTDESLDGVIAHLRKKLAQAIARQAQLLDLIDKQTDTGRADIQVTDFIAWVEENRPSVPRENPTVFYKILEVLVEWADQAADGRNTLDNAFTNHESYRRAASDCLVAIVSRMAKKKISVDQAIMEMMAPKNLGMKNTSSLIQPFRTAQTTLFPSTTGNWGTMVGGSSDPSVTFTGTGTSALDAKAYQAQIAAAQANSTP